MKSRMLKLAVLPALVILVVTLVRIHFERTEPSWPMMKFFSALALQGVGAAVIGVVLLARGASLPQMLGVELVFNFLARLPVATAYALAWHGHWTVEGTNQPVRYVKDIVDVAPKANTWQVFLMTLTPVVFGIVLALLLWSIAWAVAFRGKRPYCSAPPITG